MIQYYATTPPKKSREISPEKIIDVSEKINKLTGILNGTKTYVLKTYASKTYVFDANFSWTAEEVANKKNVRF